MLKKIKTTSAGKWIAAIVLLSLEDVLLGSQPYVILNICLIGIYVLAVSGLDLLFGYSGQISLGHAAFYCIGAYTSAILSANYGITPWITVFLGGLLSAGIGALLAFPASKLVGHFLSLLTISFGMLMYNIVANLLPDLTGGFVGFSGIPTFSIAGYEIAERQAFFFIILAFVVVFLVIKQRILASRTGRALVAIRENVVAANGMGIHVRNYKILVFAISAFYTGVAGALYAHMIGYISPDTFVHNQSVLILTMLLFGGSGSFVGPIIGAATITVLNELLQQFSAYQTLIYGIFILVVVLFMPGGLTKLFRELRKKIRGKSGKGGDGTYAES